MDTLHSVKTTFNITYSDAQYAHAKEYVDDMKKHPKRVFWIGKNAQSDEELILSQIAHRVLSGFYNNYDPSIARSHIKSMVNSEL
jgi:hypothetical protein